MRVIGMWAVGICISLGTACFQPPLERDTDEAIDTSTDTDGVDAEIGPDSVTSLVPSGLAASVERVDDVELAWSSGAPAFSVYRCDAAPCAGEWHRLTSEPITERKFRDTTALAPGAPPAPTLRIMEDGQHVDLSWDAVVAPSAPRYSYRVTAVVDGVESAPSTEVMGHRAERPVMGYEVSVAQGEWEEVGAATTWRDASADPPTLSLSGVVASQGTYAAHVELVASGVAATAGPTRSYRVRAATDFGPGAAAEATGRRKAPAVALQWQRSELEAEGFEDLPLATAAVAQDAGAPADGSARYYRVVLSGVGAQSVSSQVVAGWRQPPPGVPGGLTATTELGDRVRLSWQAVSGALGYHVYRGEQRLTSGSGIATTTFEDFDTGAPGEWAAPGSVTASTDRTDGIEVSWVAPARPVGPSASYSVSAVNPSGEGGRSASVSGRRSAPALDVWEVEIGEDGAVASIGSSSTKWLDSDAPRAVITAGSASASQGVHRRFVRLSHLGGEVGAAEPVRYRVRGKLLGSDVTPWSSRVEGERAHGALMRKWQRSFGETADGFMDVATVTETEYEDTTASDIGEKRWYRLVVSAAGATTQTLAPVQGWRLAFKKVVAGGLLGALSMDGQVWVWDVPTVIPVAIDGPEGGPGPIRNLVNVVDFAMGEGAGCAIDDTKALHCWGFNSFGQVGDGTRVDRPEPVRVETLSNVTSVGGSSHAMYARTGDGRLYSWGYNSDYSLGINSDEMVWRTVPGPVLTNAGTAVTDAVRLAKSEPFHYGTCAVVSTLSLGLRCWGHEFGAGATSLSGATSVSSVAVGDSHGCYATTDKRARCWGRGQEGQLGHGSQPIARVTSPVEVIGLWDVEDIAVVGATSCARRTNGRLACWGSNQGGFLGAGETAPLSSVPVDYVGIDEVSDLSMHGVNACVVRRGDVWCWRAGMSIPALVRFP